MTSQPTGDEPSLGGQPTPISDEPRLGGEAALLHAIEALSDPDPKVRKRAATILAERGDIRAFELLVDLMSQHSHRVEAIRLLGKLKDPRATEVLLRQLKDRFQRAEILSAVLQALAENGDSNAIDPVKHFLLSNRRYSDKPWQRIRRLAAQTVQQLGDDLLVYELADLVEDGQTELIPLLGCLGMPEAVPVLIDQLGFVKTHPNEYIITKNAIAQALGELRDPRAVEPLLELFQEQYRSKCRYSPYDTRVLMMALADIGDTRAIEPIVKILKRGHPDERQSAATALAQLNHESVVLPLIEALCDEVRAVRLSVVEALGKLFHLSPTIRAALLERARIDDQGVRTRIVGIFAQYGDRQALAA